MVSAAVLLPTPNWQHRPSSPRRSLHPVKRSIFPVARLFGPSIFEASKLKVLFVGLEDRKLPEKLPRAYTLTHSDLTARLTLAISHSINRAQLEGWYRKLQRDEVVAEWRKVRGRMSLHVHCHISGGHFLLDLIAGLRYHIFCKELPVVLKAFVHGDGGLFQAHPHLHDALVWVYFHSTSPDLNSVQCWGTLRQAAELGRPDISSAAELGSPDVSSAAENNQTHHQRCEAACDCCFPLKAIIPWPLASPESEAAPSLDACHPQQ